MLITYSTVNSLAAKVKLCLRKIAAELRLRWTERAHMEPGLAADTIQLIAKLRRIRNENPVLDPLRFPSGQSLRYDPVTAYTVVAFIMRNRANFDVVAGNLADERSREILSSIMAYRALGPGHINAPYPTGAVSSIRQVESLSVKPAVQHLPPFETFRFDFEAVGERISVECWRMNVLYTFFVRQYFFKRGEVVIEPTEGQNVVDGGSCFGDTALLFAAQVGPSGVVYAFEPLPRQREIMDSNLGLNPRLAPRISIEPFALGCGSLHEVAFADEGAAGRASSTGETKVQCQGLDEWLVMRNVDRVDFIKMDIEGGELDALKGARHAIDTFNPDLAISIYHHLDDLIGIPLHLMRAHPKYSFWIEHHSAHHEETVLYARALADGDTRQCDEA